MNPKEIYSSINPAFCDTTAITCVFGGDYVRNRGVYRKQGSFTNTAGCAEEIGVSRV